MKYEAFVFGDTRQIEITKEGLQIGQRKLDFADVQFIRPINHRVFIDMYGGESVEISMLGFSYDGFWEELMQRFSQRSLESLFANETPIMNCEGEYCFSNYRGRGLIILLSDAVCVVPQNCHAVRIPLCFAKKIILEGYMLSITLDTDEKYSVGRMGYDTKHFAEQCIKNCEQTKLKREQLLSKYLVMAPYSEKGLFRTAQQDEYYLAAIKNGKCAVELFTHGDSATYLYRYAQQDDMFLRHLAMAMESVGSNREIIYITDEQLAENPLFRMSVARCESVRFLRSAYVGRLIHTANHSKSLMDFIEG